MYNFSNFDSKCKFEILSILQIKFFVIYQFYLTHDLYVSSSASLNCKTSSTEDIGRADGFFGALFKKGV